MNIIKKERWRIMEFLLNTEKLISNKVTKEKLKKLCSLTKILFKEKVKNLYLIIKILQK